MKITGPKVTERLVVKLLQENHVDLSLCGQGNHHPLQELVQRVQTGELELAYTEREQQLEIRQTKVIVRVLYKLPNLTFLELQKQSTDHHDGSSSVTHGSGFTGMHLSGSRIEESARNVLVQNLGQSEPRFATLRLCGFSKKPRDCKTLVINQSTIWYGIRSVTKVIHFDLILPRSLYKEEYKKTYQAEGKISKITFFRWRPIADMP